MSGSSRLASDLEKAKRIDEKTVGGVTSDATPDVGGAVVSDDEISSRLSQTREMLTQLSKRLSDDIEVSDATTRLHRRLEVHWDSLLAPIVAQVSRYPATTQQRIQVLSAEKEKVTKEMEEAVAASLVDEQLTLLQRCTRQLEAAQDAEEANPDLIEALSGKPRTGAVLPK